jgi:glycosyltransferase involved in cell wall biosynthesis
MISILLPIKNGIEFLDETLASIIAQKYTNWELLIGINGFPQNSVTFQKAQFISQSICKTILYEGTEQKIRIFDLPEIQGKGNTLNKLMEYTNGSYIAIIDVDDIWMNDKLLLQYPYMGKYDVIGTRCVYFGDINGIIQPPVTGDITNFDFKLVNPIINSSALIRAELCYWKDIILDDYELWLRLRQENRTFYNLADILVKHRIHKSSAFNSSGNHLSVEDLLLQFPKFEE